MGRRPDPVGHGVPYLLWLRPHAALRPGTSPLGAAGRTGGRIRQWLQNSIRRPRMGIGKRCFVGGRSPWPSAHLLEWPGWQVAVASPKEIEDACYRGQPVEFSTSVFLSAVWRECESAGPSGRAEMPLSALRRRDRRAGRSAGRIAPAAGSRRAAGRRNGGVCERRSLARRFRSRPGHVRTTVPGGACRVARDTSGDTACRTGVSPTRLER